MTIELKDGGYAEIMDYIQKIENLAWEGIFPEEVSDEKAAYKTFQDIVSELKGLRTVVQENLLIKPHKTSPTGPRAA